MFKFWFALALVIFIVEVITPNFIMASLGLASLFTALVSYFGCGLEGQLFSFGISLFVCLFILRFFFKKMTDGSREKRTNVNALVGKKARVTDKIKPKEKGRVKIAGDSWLAITKGQEEIEPEERVEILKVEGTKVYVKRKES